MKRALWILLIPVLLLGCTGQGEPKQVFQQYLDHYKNEKYGDMWYLLSREVQIQIENQLAIIQDGAVSTIRTGGMNLTKEKVKDWTAKQYWIYCQKFFRQELEKNKNKDAIRKSFDFSSATITKVDVKEKVAIVHLKDSFGNIRKGKLVLENVQGKGTAVSEEWRVGKEPIVGTERKKKKTNEKNERKSS